MGHVSAHPMLDFLPLSPPKQYGARSTARDVGNIGTDQNCCLKGGMTTRRRVKKWKMSSE